MDELPRLITEANWNDQLGQPNVAPGSVEEERALEELDAARAREEREREEDPQSRQRRLQGYWRRHSRG